MAKKPYLEPKYHFWFMAMEDVITSSGQKALGDGDWGCEDDFESFNK